MTYCIGFIGSFMFASMSIHRAYPLVRKSVLFSAAILFAAFWPIGLPVYFIYRMVLG